MSYTNRVSEVMYPLLYEHADSIGVAVNTSARVSLANYHRAWFFLDVGDMGQAATIDVQLYQATALTGGSTAVITGKAITQLTQAGSDSNKLCCIELQTEELDVDGGYEHVYVVLTVAGAACELSWCLFGCEPRFAPTATTNWEEIVG